MSAEIYVLFYTYRSATGTPAQQWAPGVYLKDHWEICWTRREAVCQYEKLFTDGCVDVHSAGIALIDSEYETDWC